MRKIFKLPLIVGMFLTYFVGCGESGDLSPSSSFLSFPSGAISAEATIENGTQIRSIVVKDQKSEYSVVNSVTNSSNQNMLMVMRKVNLIAKETISSNSYALNAVTKEVKQCKNGGSALSVKNSFNNNKNFNITISFNNCATKTKESITFNGTIQMAGQINDNMITMNIKYMTDFILSSDTVNIKILKNSTMDIIPEVQNNATPHFKLIINAIVHEGSKISGQQNAVYYMKSQNNLYQTSGKVYINNLASYVDYDTSYDMSKTPFVFDGSNVTSGEARYNMENGGKVKIVAEDNKAKIYIDKDGDGNYELSE